MHSLAVDLLLLRWRFRLVVLQMHVMDPLFLCRNLLVLPLFPVLGDIPLVLFLFFVLEPFGVVRELTAKTST